VVLDQLAWGFWHVVQPLPLLSSGPDRLISLSNHQGAEECLVFVLSVAVVSLAVLGVLDLALTVAVIRRLRVLGERSFVPGAGGLPVGTRVPGFKVAAADGGSLTPEEFSGRRTVVAFYSTGCAGCQEQAPEFAVAAAKLTADGVQVLPVLLSGGASEANRDQAGMRDLLAKAGRLVVDSEGALARVFVVGATPYYFAIGPDGRVSGKGLTLTESLIGAPS
jgi:peroxiredoxin